MVSKEALIFSYIFTFAVLLAVMTNVCQYFYVHQPRKPDLWGRWAPFVMVSCATALMLISPLKNLAVNVCMQSFRTNGFDATIGRVLDIAYMPLFSTRLMQLYTSLAYVLLFWGTALQVDVGSKFLAVLKDQRAKWKSNAAANSACTKPGG
jgi:hypothetical protein